MLEIIGYSLACLMGVALGITGSGASILTLPILIYIFGISAIKASTYSLFIVGLSASLGIILYSKKNIINYQLGLNFAIPSILAVYFSKAYLMPIIPNKISLFGYATLTKASFIIIILIILIVSSALLMLSSKQAGKKLISGNLSLGDFILTLLKAIAIGTITGITGAGGGFLIVPALILIGNISTKQAAATSLFVVTLNCFVGFLTDIEQIKQVDYQFLMLFTSCSFVGVWVGVKINSKLSNNSFKRIFAILLLTIALIMTLEQFTSLPKIL